MPVVSDRDETIETWLKAPPNAGLALAKPYPAERPLIIIQSGSDEHDMLAEAT